MANVNTALRNRGRQLASTQVKGTGWAKDKTGTPMQSAQRNGFGLRGLNTADGRGSANRGGVGNSIAGPGNPGVGGRPLGC